MQQRRQERQPFEPAACELHQVAQVALRDDEDRRADRRAVHRPHAADHDHQQDVDHDVERQRCRRSGVAQPDRVQQSGRGRAERSDAVGGRAVDDGVVAQRLGAELVLADRLQNSPERRVDDAQQREKQDERACEHQVIGREARMQQRREAEIDAVLAAGERGQLRGEDLEERGHRKRDHGEEDRPHPQAEQADAERDRGRQQQRECAAGNEAAPARAPVHRRKADAVAADAEEHGVREGHDSGVAEQQVVARHQEHEHADLGGDVERARARKQERRERESEQNQRKRGCERATARQVAGEEKPDHLPTG